MWWVMRRWTNLCWSLDSGRWAVISGSWKMITFGIKLLISVTQVIYVQRCCFCLLNPLFFCLFVFYFSLPSHHRISKSLLSPNTVRSPRFCVQGKVSSSTFLTRKEGTTDESEKHFNLHWESSVSDRSLGIVNSIYEGVIDGSLNTCLGSSLFFFFFLKKRL